MHAVAAEAIAFCDNNPIPTAESIYMSNITTPIEVTTKTLVNGIDVTTLKDADIYSLISNEEAKIEDLQKIKAQPKKLLAEIERRQAGIAALVAYLDAQA